MPENNTNFQPISKRFMVWDKKERHFCYNHDGSYIFNIRDLAVFFINKAIDGTPHCQFELVQSTNLFSRDGEEIFEGNIVSDGTCRAVCVWDNSNAEFDFEMVKGSDQVKSWLNEYKIIGHILSNPELLEEK